MCACVRVSLLSVCPVCSHFTWFSLSFSGTWGLQACCAFLEGGTFQENSLIRYADWGAFKQYWWVCTARGLVSEAALTFASSNVEKYLPSPRAQQAAHSCLISPVSEGQEGEPWPWILGPLASIFQAVSPTAPGSVLSCLSLENEVLSSDVGKKQKENEQVQGRKIKKWTS